MLSMPTPARPMTFSRPAADRTSSVTRRAASDDDGVVVADDRNQFTRADGGSLVDNYPLGSPQDLNAIRCYGIGKQNTERAIDFCHLGVAFTPS
jgi:hypothetical protein